MNYLPIELNTLILENCNQSVLREVSKEWNDTVNMSISRIENIEDAIKKNNMLWISIYLSDKIEKINYCKNNLWKYGFGQYAEMMEGGNWNGYGYIFYLSCKYNNMYLFNILKRECLLYPAYLPLMILHMINNNKDELYNFVEYFILKYDDYEFMKYRLPKNVIDDQRLNVDDYGAGYLSSDVVILEELYDIVYNNPSVVLIPVVFATLDYKLLYLLLEKLEKL
ncbi:Transmembrane domain-containing protein [Orpheovirus IHUMI-LCC2]|uniref:Transmembrane domain-containing protein n=1 Tax=Orpheovirus IHUMI-LCC2 TaxID=2023057 RepID=A0A2I2L5R7_9VIRU|nr:Transmembrane domain-containing protein [Orpheovirus IHUMI-LCC2]SNW62799.1 Transmembrane domain-containing protein [Orpheovirus IHUMI-LCC2]